MDVIRVVNRNIVKDSGTTIYHPTKDEVVDIYQQLSAGLCSSDQGIKDGLKISFMVFSKIDTNTILAFMTKFKHWEGSCEHGFVDLKVGIAGWRRKLNFKNFIFEVDFKNLPSQRLAWEILTFCIESKFVCETITYVVEDEKEVTEDSVNDTPIPVD